VNLTARPYCTYGVACEPEPDAICVIPRGTSGWQGHVFIIEQVQSDGTWVTIGGNQGTVGEVSRAIVDPRKTQVLAVRKPVEATVEALRPHSSEIKVADKVEVSSWLALLVSSAVAAAKELITPIDIPSFTDLPAAMSWWQTAFTAVNAAGKVFLENPWLGGSMVCCVFCVVVARVWRTKRVKKHQAGIPISSQVEVSA
jgi:hypothetical protein